MKNLSDFNLYCLIVAILVAFFLIFIYFDPVGIKIGYKLSGGDTVTEESAQNSDELLRSYKEQVRTYELYKDSDNSTAQRWAEDARVKANSIAKEYNKLMDEFILNGIGE